MDSLHEYRRKRPKGASPEPRGGTPTTGHNSFVIQRHDATRLHYDFRLEMNGVLSPGPFPRGPLLIRRSNVSRFTSKIIRSIMAASRGPFRKGITAQVKLFCGIKALTPPKVLCQPKSNCEKAI